MPEKKEKQPTKRPTWVSFLIRLGKELTIPVLCIIALIAGLTVGYVYVGKRSMDEVWMVSTWKHLWDLVFGS